LNYNTVVGVFIKVVAGDTSASERASGVWMLNVKSTAGVIGGFELHRMDRGGILRMIDVRVNEADKEELYCNLIKYTLE
jgi:hypothetical protein